MGAEARRTGDQGLPKRIGQYEAFLQIGAGGMARVYLAVQRAQPGQKAELVVVKLLRPEVVEDDHVVSLFTDEARIAMRLDHPNVIRTREVMAAPPDYLLAMDFHDGRSLLDILNRVGKQGLALEEHIYVLTKVLAGLSYAHELKTDDGQLGIVHRDVSPANVLVSYSGEVKLLDFGIAKATGALAATRDGVVRGKLGYAAPEQCLGQPADPRSDVYAVGVMLWEAIAGRRRASGETWQSVLQARLDDTEPALNEVCPEAPAELARIVNKAVARDPDDRYPTARAFQADLERYLERTRRSDVGPSRLAALLKPHFERDRAELREAIRIFLESRRSGRPSRMPLAAGRVVTPEPTIKEATRHTLPTLREENTAPIPVDTALLIMSRGEEEASPNSSIPTVPPPPALTTTAPPPPNSSAITAPPPPQSAATTTPPPPSHAAAESKATPPKHAPLEVDPFGVVVMPNLGSAPAWSASAADTVPSKKKAPVLPLVLVAAGILGVGALVIVPRLTEKKEATPAPDSKSMTSVSRPASTTPAAPKVETVKVRISVDPADAVLTLDGRELEGNPFVANLPKDSAEHELVAVAEACKDHRQTIRLSGDRSLLVAMKCQREGLRIETRTLRRRPSASASAATATSETAAPAESPASPQPQEAPAEPPANNP